MNSKKRFWVVSTSLTGVCLLVAGVLYSTASTAAPVVAWTPGSITDTISPGQSQSIPISFTASANLNNAVISVVPALQGLVQVTPSMIATVHKGQTIQLTLRVSAPPSAPLAVTQGTIQMRVGSPTIAQPLPVQIIVASDAVGLLPPDPGAAGMATLAGIDSDNDGVRDDIERYIWLTFPQSARQRSALTQAAIALQALVLGGAPQTNLQQLTKAIDCVNYTFMTGDADVAGGEIAHDVYLALRAITLNTPNRVRAFSNSNSQFGPSIVMSNPYAQKVAACTTAPSSFPN